MDRISKAQRSVNMSLVSAKGNKSTEIGYLKLLRKNRIFGWRRNQNNIFGKPDFVFKKEKIAIFIDGCFWHGCVKCKNIPASNKNFWTKKIKGNVERDKKVNKYLMGQGWKVVRFWEHDIKKHPENCIAKTLKLFKLNK